MIPLQDQIALGLKSSPIDSGHEPHSADPWRITGAQLAKRSH